MYMYIYIYNMYTILPYSSYVGFIPSTVGFSCPPPRSRRYLPVHGSRGSEAGVADAASVMRAALSATVGPQELPDNNHDVMLFIQKYQYCNYGPVFLLIMEVPIF